MKSLMIALVLAASATPVSAAESAKSWTDADAAEHDGIIDTYYLPLVESTNAAVQLVTSDRGQACARAKEAKVRFDATDKAFAALKARIRAEGKDMTVLGEMNSRLDQLRPKMPEFIVAMCEAPFKFDDPEQQAEFDKLTRMIQPYMAAMSDATQAMAAGDMPRTCTRFAEARAALNVIDAHMVDLKKKYGKDPAVVERVRRVQEASVTWKAQIAEIGADCPAQ